MLLGCHTQIDYISSNGIEIESNKNKLLIGVILDNDLKFDAHIKSLCKNATLKLSAFCQINKYLSYYQNFLFVNSVVKSHFTYCPLIWIFCSTTMNNSFNHMHERALRLVPNNCNSYFYDILFL